MSRFDSKKYGPSQRQLRVGELVRHALAEVRMSADLKHATVLVAPLAAPDPDAVVDRLNRSARFLRGRIAPALRQMRSMPDLKFRLDTRFEDDSRIDRLLRSPEAARDLGGDGKDQD